MKLSIVVPAYNEEGRIGKMLAAYLGYFAARYGNDFELIVSVNGTTDGTDSPAFRKAVKESSVVCLECGKSFKVLTKKHLAAHNLTPEEYRAKYGYKKGAPLAAKSLQRERRKKMKDMRLWERRRKVAQ